MSFHESISAAVTRYYVFNGLFREGEEQMTFEIADSYLIEASQSLENEFIGAARKFSIVIENFDEDTHQTEIIIGFTIWPYEDDESEIRLILDGIKEELEKMGFIEDDAYYLGDGPDIR